MAGAATQDPIDVTEAEPQAARVALVPADLPERTPVAQPGLAAVEPTGGPFSPSALLANYKERLHVCEMLANAGNVLPVCYRNKPGAVMVVWSFAEKYGLDLLTATNGIYVDNNGKTIISAELRIEVAQSMGYEFDDITPDDKRRETCTIQVTRPDRSVRTLTVNMTDVHEEVRADKTSNQKWSTWAKNPEDMLWRTAQRRAEKRFCRGGLSVIGAHLDDYGDPVDTAMVPAEQPSRAAQPAPTPAPPPPVDDAPPADAPAGDAAPAETVTAKDLEAEIVAAGQKRNTILREMANHYNRSLTLEAIAAEPDLVAYLRKRFLQPTPQA